MSHQILLPACGGAAEKKPTRGVPASVSTQPQGAQQPQLPPQSACDAPFPSIATKGPRAVGPACNGSLLPSFVC